MITEKDRPLTPNHATIKRIAREIAEARIENLLIVHGGGSFGHYMAKKYGVGISRVRAGGFSRIHQAMVTLSRLIVNALISAGLPAIEVQPSALITMRRGEIVEFRLRALRQMLAMGLVPVLYGDIVPDVEDGASIVSGDKIVSYLARELEASRAVICVDVDGIYTEDPSLNPRAELIEEFSASEIEAKLGPSSRIDVTGGMINKIREMATIVSRTNVLIVNGLKEGLVRAALLGEKVTGTRLTP